MIQFFIFFLGLIVGSFLNCVIYRLAAPLGRASPSEAGREKGESFLKGRSHCPHCKHELRFFDLIPVLSFIWLKGRCRYCGQKISIQYPLVEIATGSLFLLIFNFQFSIFNYFITPFLIVIFVYDLKYYIIPDKVIYSAIGVALIYDLLRSDPALAGSDLFVSLGAAAFFLVIVLISRGRWMGAGDIKLAFLMGLILGWPNIAIALFLAFLSGAIIGVGLIVFGKKTMKSEVPFGPFLVSGTFIALFLGEPIIKYYLNLFS